jgi:hypothetical protein
MRSQAMYAVVRRYASGAALADALVQAQPEVTDLLRSIPGFQAYYALRSADDAVATITICGDKAGADESITRAATWVRANLAGASVSAPEITEGETFLSF